MHHQIKKLIRRAAALGIVSTLCVTSAFASTATVNASILRLRSNASTSSTILANVSSGSTVDILSSAGNGWYKVSYNNVEGYMSGQYLIVSDNSSSGYAQVNTGGSSLNLRSGAGTAYGRLTVIPDGAVLTLGDCIDGWYVVSYNGETGYVSSSYLTLMDESTANAAIAASQASVSGVGQQIASMAQKYIGYSYVYGASGPNAFDCSGFSRYIYGQFGYSLSHSATAQLSYGYYVGLNDLQPGDLVFFRHGISSGASHVGIYIGNGQFVHASTAQTGVRTDSLYSDYYSGCFIGGRHVVS
jgi:cell wall-associated NlpC family hydrolase